MTADRVAIVTGAGSGIGAAVARMLARSGHRLVLTGRREAPLNGVASAVEAAGGEALVVPGDVASYEHIEAVTRAAVETFGPVDVLVASAGVADFGPIAEGDPVLWQEVIETNVLGVLYAVRAVLPAMQTRGAGHVVIIASVSGRVTYTGEPAYVSSKHATVAFGDVLRQEAAAAGIRVTLIEPGLVETPLIHVYEAADDLVPGVVPLEPDDIARAVVFALEQPPNVSVAEIVLRPTNQVL